MKDSEDYEVSELHEKWLDGLHCLIGFTITYANGRIDNQMRNCNKETYLREKAELNYLRKKFLTEKN